MTRQAELFYRLPGYIFVDKRIVIISKDPVFGGSVKVTYGIGLAIYWANLSQNKWW